MMGNNVCGILLAGGQSRRMGGGDKCLRTLGDKTILQHVIDRVSPQVKALAINANGDPSRFAGYDLPVVADSIEGFAGPLAGVLTGMEWAADQLPGCERIATLATDTPFVPLDLVARLETTLERSGADIAVACSGGRAHPVFALWPVSLRDDLRDAMIHEKVRKVDIFTARYTLVSVDWPNEPLDPFYNVNHPEDFDRALELLHS